MEPQSRLDEHSPEAWESYSSKPEIKEHPGASSNLLPTGDSGHPKSREKRGTLASILQWKYELIAVVFSALALVAIALLLNRYDNEATPHWPYWITIPTVIAILTNCFKAAMLFVVSESLGQLKWMHFTRPRRLMDLATFDFASRGPWGSLQLLLVRTGLLPILAVLIILLAVAVDPFTQQTVNTYNCMRLNATTNASLPIVKTYMENVGPEMPLLMQGALFTGVMDSENVDTLVSATCATGNCTFSTSYSSLGVCNTCSSVIYEGVQFNQYNHTGRIAGYYEDPGISWRVIQSYTVQLEGLDPTAAAEVGGSTLVLQQPPYFNDSSTFVMFSDAPYDPALVGVNAQVINVTVLAFTRQSCTTNWIHNQSADARNELTDCYVPSKGLSGFEGYLKAQPVDAPNLFTGSPKTLVGLDDWMNVTAVNCLMSLCVKTFNATVEAGMKQERLLSSAPVVVVNKADPNVATVDRPKTVQVIPSTCNVDGITHDLSDILADASPADLDGIYERSGNKSLIDACTYSVSANTMSGLTTTIGAFVSGNANTNANPGILFLPVQDQIDNWRSPDPFFSPTITSINDTLHGAAEALSQYMRNHDNDGATARGAVQYAETCIHARYWWLALPIALLIGALAILIALIMSSVRSQVPPVRNAWRSNILAVLFHGLDDDGDRHREARNAPGDQERALDREGDENREAKATSDFGLRLLEKTGDMDEAARKTRVQLYDTAEGYRFVIHAT
ncbi:MAG: hypothetical protein M1828_001726 [Chrysothrix sp. TS-e1954]|nr:MAG: hypothetical protein M1828_001726 [Chrysothrix sp. TS-e1954]